MVYYESMNEINLAMLKLVAVFAVIIIAMQFKMKLYMSIGLASLACAILFKVPVLRTGQIIIDTVTSRDFITVIIVLYLITFLQRMLEKKNQLKLAQKDLDNLFHNRRINTTVAPILIGLLPSPAAAMICGEIVSEAAGDSLDKDEKAAVTSYFRHIPESFLPTYSAVIIMADISHVPVGKFVLGMLPMIMVLYVLGYLFFITKVPRGEAHGQGKVEMKHLGSLIKHLWTIIMVVVLIMAFKMSTLTASAIIIIIAWFVYRFELKELKDMAVGAIEPSMILITLLVYIFKELLTEAGVIYAIPEFFSALPIPPLMIFILIFFFGTVVLGSKAVITICTSLAYAAIPDGGWPLMVLLHSCAYAAMQISPTHVCMVIIADYFKSSLGAMSRKLLPLVTVFVAIVTGYYLLLKMFI